MNCAILASEEGFVRVRKGTSKPIVILRGEASIPGDKSVSHRALMLGALAVGETRIEGLLEGEDVLRTAAAMRAMGAEVEQFGSGSWRVAGVGVGGLAEPDDVLDMGNAGTGARLLMGVLAGHDMTAFLTGDASLRSRPMARIADPLGEMGARILSRDGGRLPLAVIGAADPMPIEYRLPVPSAQVKSAILLAGLNAPGETSVIEPEPTRDHTERMMRHFGATVCMQQEADGARRVTLVGQPELEAANIVVPRDLSSAAFPIIGALIVAESEIALPGIGLNPHRNGLLVTLREMGADIEETNPRDMAGEPVADLVIRHGELSGVTVPAARAPSMIDEYPVLAVAAAFASGETRMCGLSELRVKESDRLAAIVDGLIANGVDAAIEGDNLIVAGNGTRPAGGGTAESRHDHRIAMSFLVMGMGATRPITVDDTSPIDTSFPGFAGLMNAMGAEIEGDMI
jgi:3-phosphoshikimate 1-carboxyvinyltransferase